MLEKKTQWELWKEINNDDVQPQDHWENIWISQESLLLLLQRYEDLGHDEGIIKCLKKDLKGKKE